MTSEAAQWRKEMVEKGPFKPFYIHRSRYEGYVVWPKNNFADGVEWGSNEGRVKLATEEYCAIINQQLFKKELSIKEIMTRPDWKPLQWWQDNEPQLTAFDYFFTPEQLKLSRKANLAGR
jgi:hypothetical protein